MITLRDYQLQAVNGAQQAFASGLRAVMIEAATGSGKTITFSELAARHLNAGGLRVLVVAHRHELLTQALDSLRSHLDGSYRVTRDLDTWPIAAVVVASVQTVARRLDRIPPNAFDLIIVDECHHSPSSSYQDVFAHFARARIFGVTATTDRADGVSLATVYETCVSRYDIVDGIRDGHLTPIRGFLVEVPGMDLSKVRRRVHKTSDALPRDVADLHPGDLSRAAIAPEAVEGVAGPLLELAEGRKTVVFAVDRRHGRAITDALNARRPGCAKHVDGSMRGADRAAVQAAHRAGAFQFLVNVMLLTEGYNDPSIECVAIARPTQSRILYAQAAGRGLRVSVITGKRECLLLDFVGVSCEHSLVGPEDVLAGALIAPVQVLRPNAPAAPTPVVLPAYVPTPARVPFVARVVELVRRGARGVKEAVLGAGRAVRAAPRAVGRGLLALLFGQ